MSQLFFWWKAVTALSSFEDGSLVFDDSTVDVAPGSTVNLRVKLGARPRDDVTVTASESLDGITVTGSRTFTRQNWDTFQNFVVTADSLGNSVELALPAVAFNAASTSATWLLAAGSRPNIPTPIGGASRFLQAAQFLTDSTIILSVADSQNDFTARADLSDAYETNGSIRMSAGGETFTVPIGGLDFNERYDYNPIFFTVEDQLNISAAATDWITHTDGTLAGTLTLFDYDATNLPSGTISLSASGTDEYTGVTGSATVSVT